MSLSRLQDSLYTEDGRIFDRPIDWYAGLAPIGHDADERLFLDCLEFDGDLSPDDYDDSRFGFPVTSDDVLERLDDLGGSF